MGKEPSSYVVSYLTVTEVAAAVFAERAISAGAALAVSARTVATAIRAKFFMLFDG